MNGGWCWLGRLATARTGFARASRAARRGKAPRGALRTTRPDDLAAWYARAAIFAFPSLDEGFGMPVLEAMAGGAPVLTSNRSALPEVAGDAAILVDPENTQALIAALRGLADDEALRQDLAARGLARSRLFTWEKAVRQTWEVYEEAVRRFP